MLENEDGESVAYRQVDQNSIVVFKFPKCPIQNEICTMKRIVQQDWDAGSDKIR